jgi:Domain of unknown function (DUF4331)
MTDALASRTRLLVVAAALAGALALVLTLTGGPAPQQANAASHREAPLISLDPAADITDFFMFRSYEPGKDDKVVLIMDVYPGGEPSSGPNYFTFDPNVRYRFGLDTSGNGRAEDVQIEFRFRNEIRGAVNALGLPLSYVGGVPPATGAVIPPITKLEDGPGSEGLGLRQRYSVKISSRANFGRGPISKSTDNLIAVPSNVGPRTMPNYPALADQGVYDLGGGVRVFAGQRQDPFYIDLGGVFDTLNLRMTPPLLSPLDDAADNANSFGINMLSTFNVQTIAIELPASMITSDAKGPEQTAFPKIGAYASTYRSSPSVRGRGTPSSQSVQVQRLANPLVNELIIGTKDKDEWNTREPFEEKRFLDYFLRPRLALAFELIFGPPTGCTPFGSPACEPDPPGSKPFAEWNRDDLVAVLLGGKPTDHQLSELLRLDLSVDPVPLAGQKRLTVLAGDNAGWPNGRRPRDDVVDLAIRVVGGPNYITNRAGDGVNVDDADLLTGFPFLGLPADGRDYVSGAKQTPHENPVAP